MLRIGQVEPTAQNNLYTDGNVAGGIAATRLRAAAFNAIQEELAYIIENSGGSLSTSDNTQVLTALKELFAPLISPGLTGIPTAPTAAPGTNTTQLANTSFVKAAIAAAPGRLLNVQLFTTPGAATYTPTTGMKTCVVEVLGAGGGSGGCPATSSTQYSAAAGGGGGAWAKVLLTSAQIGSSQTVTIGAGGTAGTTSGSGGVGGSSTFGAIITCPGGTASLFGTAISTSSGTIISGANPGTVPTITLGTVIQSMAGTSGGNAYIIFNNVLSGIGGASPAGNGGNANGSTANSGYGSGGPGNANQAGAAAQTGQVGKGGYICVWEYA